jgi:hypothetical protein
MPVYTQATINAMNARGKALLDLKKTKPPKPVYTVPAASSNVTSQLNGLPYAYTPPPKTTTAGTQTSYSSGSAGSVPSWQNTEEPSSVSSSDTGTAKTGVTSIAPETIDTSINDYYADLLRKQEEAARQRTQSALEANNAYIPQINQYSDKQLQDAYISKELNRVNLPQQLSALGYSGGATETSMMGAQADYENRRGTIEQDRGDSLNKIRQNASQIEATGNADLADMSAQYYRDMIQKAQRDAETEKSEYASTVGAYASDYQAQINKLIAAGYSPDSYEVKVLNAARNQKISNQQSSQADADQRAFENYLKNAQLQYNISKPYFKPSSGGGGSLSYSEALERYNDGERSSAVLSVLGLD